MTLLFQTLEDFLELACLPDCSFSLLESELLSFHKTMDALGPAPPGGDRDRGYILVAVSVTTFAFVALSGALRLITRAFIIRQLGWDDFCISLALVG